MKTNDKHNKSKVPKRTILKIAEQAHGVTSLKRNKKKRPKKKSNKRDAYTTHITWKGKLH